MAAASTALNAGNVIDAEFETVIPVCRSQSINCAPVFEPSAGLSILRGADPDAIRGRQPDQLTPTFLVFTAFAALVVFWVCGGRFLLY